MTFIRAEVWGEKLCEQLGLDPHQVERLVIDIMPNAVPMVYAEITPTQEQIDALPEMDVEMVNITLTQGPRGNA